VKAIVFWPVALFVIVLDVVTKSLAVMFLAPSGAPHEVVGQGFRFALVYNPGAAFGLYLGDYSRWIFMVLTVGALYVLWRLYQQTSRADIMRTLAISLVAAGAIGNLLDRIRTELGVVDFIDLGFGDHRWPTFNVADMAVSSGAFLLAWVLWGEDRKEVAVVAPSALEAQNVSAATSVLSSHTSATSTPTATAIERSDSQ
jgi:signal peptidase II